VDAARKFVAIEASGGLVLIAAAMIALVWVNSPASSLYHDLWESHVAIETPLFSIDEDLKHWVNDGLMTIFFFVVGLEIKRELSHGELSSFRRALFPAIAAAGGMIAPAVIYLAINAGGPGESGWGIPMATDIAFSLGVLSLVGSRIPFGVKIFLLALAIVDDIGAVIVIAIFYSSSIEPEALGLALALLVAVVWLNRSGVHEVGVYVAIGIVIWIATLESGVHATLAGVALGLLTPARSYYAGADYPRSAAVLLDRYQSALDEEDEESQQAILSQASDLSGGTESPLDRLERALHSWVSYAIVPIFALANAGVDLGGGVVVEAMSSSVSWGVAAGLLIGKPLGIFAFTWSAVKLGLCQLPDGAAWPHILSIGLLASIGFTVSLLITGLAFQEETLIDEAKLGVLAASVIASLAGLLSLLLFTRKGSSRSTS
jgi:NhaA family Na+:H+ antiporter